MLDCNHSKIADAVTVLVDKIWCYYVMSLMPIHITTVLNRYRKKLTNKYQILTFITTKNWKALTRTDEKILSQNHAPLTIPHTSHTQTQITTRKRSSIVFHTAEQERQIAISVARIPPDLYQNWLGSKWLGTWFIGDWLRLKMNITFR